jgi:uncharacterized protein YciI
MKKRYAYIFFLKPQSDRITQTVPKHTKYWKSSTVEDFLGGTFADDSGGIISFSANGLEEVSEIILNDPLNKQNLIENRLIKEWIMDEGVLS